MVGVLKVPGSTVGDLLSKAVEDETKYYIVDFESEVL